MGILWRVIHTRAYVISVVEFTSFTRRIVCRREEARGCG